MVAQNYQFCYNDDMMQYTLITKNGKILQFYIGAVAEMYKKIYGGYIITEDILVDKTRQSVV